ncbi:MAG TPA: hypothetical protein VJ779_04625 [Acetobacteraceae bacterium]|nr:hypothetical protein [Acetobacteraceae bacterium]
MDQGYDADAYVAPLTYLGLRNTREGTRNLAKTIMLHQRTGVHVNLSGGPDLDSLLAAGRTLAAAGALLSFEGPNEPNNFPITHKGRQGGGGCATCTWAPVAEFQRDLYAAVKSDANLKRYPVFSVSEGGAETDNVGLQFLAIPGGAETLLPAGTKFADYANVHNYVIGNARIYGDNQAWRAADPTLDGPWDGLYCEYGLTWLRHFPGYSDRELQVLPRVTTETGWDSVSDPGGERVQGTVLVNTYLAQFKRGWRYTFIFELVDGQGSSTHQGLYRADLTPKPAAFYIHNLTKILADSGIPSHFRHLAYAIPNQPETVHDMLLEKSNGRLDLVVWGESVSAKHDISIALESPAKLVNVYDVTAGADPIKTLRDTRTIPIELSDHAVVLEIRE